MPAMRSALFGAASALAITLTLSAPAAADHFRGHAAMGHPHCQEYLRHHPDMQGHGGCPYLHGKQSSPSMAGKTLGVMVSDLPNALLDEADMPYGISVQSVKPDSAAATAGIRAGDVIAEFSGKPVFSAERLRWLVRKAPSGKGVEIKLVREGNNMVLVATLAETAAQEKCKAMPAPGQGT